MKDKILPILLLSTILISCSSVYKSGQTPDDVYYSPAREVAKTEDKEEEKQEEKTASTEDQYLKMKVRDRYRWSRIDDYDYWTDTRYNTHCNCMCNPPATVYNSYGYYPIRYNSGHPSYYPYIYSTVKYVNGNTSASIIKAYNNRTFSNTNAPVNPKTGASSSTGSFLKRVLTSSGTSVDRTERTYSGSSSTSGSTTTSSSAGGRSGGMNTTGSGSNSGKSRGN